MTLPATIRTAVSQEAITKVTRLFNGTIGDVLNELLQNARRAGTSCVHIETHDPGGRLTLCVRDDGHGIADPTALVTLGRSNWDEGLLRREDPAGMGVFSLAGRHIEIRSRPDGATTGWRVIIPADAWETSSDLPVEPFALDRGTTILIDLPDTWARSLESAATHAARYYPLPVHLNGRELPKEDFLHDALRVELWNGCRIGVFPNSIHHGAEPVPRVNFHGVTVRCTLPTITEVGSFDSWQVLVDIVDAPDLQLVLPARKEMVVNATLEALREACRRAIFRTIAHGGEHRLSFTEWTAAHDLGVSLPEATPWLNAWRPTTAETGGHASVERTEAVPMIIVPHFESDIDQSAAPVLTKPLTLGATAVTAESSFEGYSWYDDLPRVAALHFEIEADGALHRYGPEDALPDALSGDRFPAMDLALTVAVSGHADAPCEEREHPLSVIVYSGGSWNLDDASVFIHQDADLDPRDLADLLERSIFRPDDDYDCDSHETQRERFVAEARLFANTLLLGEEEALLRRLRDALRDDISWLVPHGRQLTATLSNAAITVTLTDVSAA